MKITDTERINFLQKMMVDDAVYTKKCIFRNSTMGRGYRLHESDDPEASDSVRDQIDRAMTEHLENLLTDIIKINVL